MFSKITGKNGGLAFFDGNYLTRIKYIITSILRPVTYDLWFVSAYILLIFACPLVNKLISSFTRKGFVSFLIFVWFFYYSIDYIFERDYLPLGKAFFFYVLGAFVRLYLPEKKIHKRILLLLVCFIMLGIMTYCNFIEMSHITSSVQEDSIIFVRDCFSVPVFSFCFFILFYTLELNNYILINKIASATFGIYLIHHSAFCRRLIWRCVLEENRILFACMWYSFFAVFYIVLVFSVCATIDLIRQKYIGPLYSTIVEKLWKNIKTSLFKAETH